MITVMHWNWPTYKIEMWYYPTTMVAQNRVTFHEAYANIVSDIGGKTAIADISLQSSQALKSQSQDWFDSISGVNLDEEAANLVRFQQTYAASARILTTAQQLFDTILNSTR